jgi:hypothetical protein
MPFLSIIFHVPLENVLHQHYTNRRRCEKATSVVPQPHVEWSDLLCGSGRSNHEPMVLSTTTQIK